MKNVRLNHIAIALLATGTLATMTACGPISGEDNADSNASTNAGTNADMGEKDADGCTILTSEAVSAGSNLAKGCYSTDEVLSVTGGVLELAAGVSIKFGENAGISVTSDGRLKAVGTSEDPIVLTGKEETAGHWAGVYFYQSSSTDNKLDHVTISYAGGDAWTGADDSRGAVYLRDSDVQVAISNTTFASNEFAGLHADGPEAKLTLDSSTFSKNALPILLPPNLVGPLGDDLTFEDNTTDVIELTSTDTTIDVEQSWPAYTAPYRATGTVYVRAKLTVEPGATIEFTQDIGIDVQDEGRLNAVGEEGKEITFTGVENTRGYWAGLYFYQSRSADNKLDHAVVEYAGGAAWTGADDSRGGVYMRDEGVSLAISNSTFRENGFQGVHSDADDAELTISGTTFVQNERAIALTANNAKGLADDLVFENNDKDYVQVMGGTVSTDQTWAALAAPYRFSEIVYVTKELTLTAGTIFEMDQDTGLEISTDGVLKADASGGDPIEFIPADGETVSGFHRGVHIDSKKSNVLSNAKIISAGSEGWHGGSSSIAGLFISGEGNVALSDIEISKSGSHGLSVDGEGTVTTCGNMTFNENTDDDVHLDGDPGDLATLGCAM